MSDLIKREDAIRATDECFALLARLRVTARQALEKVPSADRPQKWILCSERLPSEFSNDERVLATTEVDGLGVILIPAYDVKSWYLKGYITAWMPLPKPWKGADDEVR